MGRFYQNDVKLSSNNKPGVKQAQRRFNSVYSMNYLPKIESGSYVINLDEYVNVDTLSILFMLKMI